MSERSKAMNEIDSKKDSKTKNNVKEKAILDFIYLISKRSYTCECEAQ